VDLGQKALATISDGNVIEGPKARSFYLKRLPRLSRAHARPAFMQQKPKAAYAGGVDVSFGERWWRELSFGERIE
jgi:hypothetical protein